MPADHMKVSSSDQYFVSTDRSLLDVDTIYGFLSTCYWSPGIARSRVERAIEHSLCFGLYDSSTHRVTASKQGDPLPTQVGFARVVSDYASFAYLCDVFVLESHRGRGLSKRMMQEIMAFPSLQGLRRFCLLTLDAHGLYKQFGFASIPDAARYMEKIDRESFKREMA
ncbi:MAG: GNAT family N-acetyltransferase [Phycisphaerales bacterium]